jgi:cell division protein FtsB
MPRRSAPPPADAAPPAPAPGGRESASDTRAAGAATDTTPEKPDLGDLPVLGFSRRRVGYALGVVLAVWIVIVFARQVGEASAASQRAEDLEASNAALATRVESLERELALIARQEYIVQQARGHRLGGGREVPFQLAADAPALPPDSPGSASVRLGAEESRRSPLEAWLDVLFGPDV